MADGTLIAHLAISIHAGWHEYASDARRAPCTRHRRLLRARRQRPHSRSAAQERDEVAALQLIELHSIPASQGRVAGYRIGGDQSAGIEMILQPILVLPVLAGDRPATRSAR
jgi:hypothetical protein